MRAAAENLTPVTLELGGKSPAIVGRGFPVAEAAGRVMFGKCLNAGQTCIAPDYALVPEESVAAFVDAARAAVASLYPALAANPDYTSRACSPMRWPGAPRRTRSTPRARTWPPPESAPRRSSRASTPRWR
jgi:acyl-CoA reductase-like NAD-dependent aldehyde dehydrogenase